MLELLNVTIIQNKGHKHVSFEDIVELYNTNKETVKEAVEGFHSTDAEISDIASLTALGSDINLLKRSGFGAEWYVFKIIYCDQKESIHIKEVIFFNDRKGLLSGIFFIGYLQLFGCVYPFHKFSGLLNKFLCSNYFVLVLS